MSERELLTEVIGNLRKLADALQAVADDMKSEDSSVTPERDEKDSVQAAAPVPVETTNEKVPTKEEVRAVLARKKIEDARALITKYGAKKLTEIAPENYASLLNEASELPDDDKRNGGNA